jgi:hypothetical protein
MFPSAPGPDVTFVVHRPPQPPLILVLLLAGACSGGASDRVSRISRDSAGVPTVRIPDLRSVAAPVWRTDPAFSTEHEDSLGLGVNAQAAFTPNSELLVTGPDEIFRFDSSGQLMGQIGRAGDGPGEFRSPFQLLVGADNSVLVGDRAGRLTQFGSSGEVIRVIPRLPAPAAVELDPIGVLADGRLLVTYWQQRPNRGGHPGIAAGSIERDSAPLMVYGATGSANTRLGLWRGLERAQVQLEGEPSRLPLLFARSAVYDGRGARTVIGPSDSMDFSVYADTILILRLTSPLRVDPPPAKTVDDQEHAIVEADPGVGPAYLRAIRSAPAVSSMPAVGGVRLDDQGNIWVGAYTTVRDATRHWWIFSDHGVPVGQLDLPALNDPFLPGRMELLDVFNDRLAILRMTERGEAVVEVRTIRRSPVSAP